MGIVFSIKILSCKMKKREQGSCSGQHTVCHLKLVFQQKRSSARHYPAVLTTVISCFDFWSQPICPATKCSSCGNSTLNTACALYISYYKHQYRIHEATHAQLSLLMNKSYTQVRACCNTASSRQNKNPHAHNAPFYSTVSWVTVDT